MPKKRQHAENENIGRWEKRTGFGFPFLLPRPSLYLFNIIFYTEYSPENDLEGEAGMDEWEGYFLGIGISSSVVSFARPRAEYMSYFRLLISMYLLCARPDGDKRFFSRLLASSARVGVRDGEDGENNGNTPGIIVGFREGG